MFLKTAPLSNDYDNRSPLIPDDTYFYKILNHNFSYPYPTKWDSNDIQPCKTFAKNIEFNAKQAFNLTVGILHASEKISITAETILISFGSIIAAKEIELKATVIKILDNNTDFPVRTTLLASEKFSMSAKTVELDGVDIFYGGIKVLDIGHFESKNTTPNTMTFVRFVQELEDKSIVKL